MTYSRNLLKDGRALFIAYDQGFEHGPSMDFNLTNVDPEYVIDIARRGKFSALMLHNGIAEKYCQESKQHLPLVIKLNGKTNIAKQEPISLQVCSVERALKLGARAVGYTVFIGSKNEAAMLSEFGRIVEKAHDAGIPAIMWAYPRGESVKNETSTETLAHAARVALEMGADFVKLYYNNDLEGFKWVVKSAGRTRVIVAGGNPESDDMFLKKAREAINAGASGMAIGRQIWQHNKPLELTEKLRKIIFH